MKLGNDFNRDLVMTVHPHHQRRRDNGKVDDTDAGRQRMSLGDKATRSAPCSDRLETEMREDMA
jgi:hypothetical protein